VVRISDYCFLSFFPLHDFFPPSSFNIFLDQQHTFSKIQKHYLTFHCDLRISLKFWKTIYFGVKNVGSVWGAFPLRTLYPYKNKKIQSNHKVHPFAKKFHQIPGEIDNFLVSNQLKHFLCAFCLNLIRFEYNLKSISKVLSILNI
jgi:hypothetical protein